MTKEPDPLDRLIAPYLAAAYREKEAKQRRAILIGWLLLAAATWRLLNGLSSVTDPPRPTPIVMTLRADERQVAP